ncbi:MAG: guanylate kinase [Anaerolineaceae bacterium]|nr:guanylate kinase [Anaerolineaceae bacterium]
MISDTVDFDVFHPQPLLIVISGPSGVGKDSVLKEIKNRGASSYAFITTATSREPRPGEIEGVDYFFVSKAEFERMIAAQELIEYNKVYSDYKGIPKAQVKTALSSNKDVIVRVDVQGALCLKTLYPEAVFIFLVPDNAAVWYHRLKNRKTETAKEFALRIKTAKTEMEHLAWFDYMVINAENHLEDTVATIEAIITAEHHRSRHRVITT